jgi:hypothetical protein
MISIQQERRFFMNLDLFKHNFLILALALGLMIAMAQTPALAAGGSLDPADQPLISALAIQIGAIDNRLLKAVGGGSPDPMDLPVVKRLASRLSEVDLHLGMAAVGGGTPDPAEYPLIEALLALRLKTEGLRGHLESAVAAAETIPILNEITMTRTLKYMLRTSQMVILRIDFALIHTDLPTPIPDF